MIEASFTDSRADLLVDSVDLVALESSSDNCMARRLSVVFSMKNAGLEGTGREREELLSMSATEAMFGLSAKFS